jgi:hypothetical protein
MRSSWKAASVGKVWLTAVMTLVAGIPQFDCGCAREIAKPQASSQKSQAGCGCGGKCCSSHRAAGCCHARTSKSTDSDEQSTQVVQHSATNTDGQPTVQPSQCVKVLVQAEAYSPATSTVSDTMPASFLSGHAASAAIVPAPVFAHSLAAHYPLAPPPDLLTLHQHFII